MSKIGQILLFAGFVLLILWLISMAILIGNMMPFVWVFLGLGVACIVGAVFKDMPFFVDLAGQRTTKHGLNLSALVVIVLALIVGVNFVAHRRDKKFDMTKEGIHSLSDQTKGVLGKLTEKLQVRAYYAENQGDGAADRQKFKDLVEWYTTVSPHLSVLYVNPVKKPEEAKADEITMPGTVVLEYKGRKAKFEEISEQAFTNAIIKITRDKNKVIYFVTGHGEREVTGNETGGAQTFKKYLGDSSYDVKTLSFAATPKVPEDAEVVVVDGPVQPYFEPEIDAIKDYLYRGGKLLLALDPGTKTNLGSLALQLGVEFKNNYVLDPLGRLVGGGGATAIGSTYSGSSEITKGFRAMTVFHIASQLRVAKNKPDGYTVEEVVKSSPQSFSKGELKAGQVHFTEGKDEMGPLTLVATVNGKMKEQAGKGPAKDFTAVIAGDSDFTSNQLIDFQLNRDLALNSVAYLAKDKELVNIRPKVAESSVLAITQLQGKLVGVGLVFVLPLALFFVGGTFWFRRRTA